MGVLRLGVITRLFSDAVVNGFTTGSAFWVFTTQIKHVIAIYPKRHTGAFALILVQCNFFRMCLYVCGAVGVLSFTFPICMYAQGPWS